MKTEYLKIDMELVRKIIRDKGYYYITAERLFDKHFVGSKLYIVTDDPEFKEKHPQLAEMTIMSVVEFEPIAQAVNDYIGQEDKDRHRERIDIESHEVQNLITDESIVIISHSGMHRSATRKTVIRIKERTNPKQGTHRSAQGTHLQMVSQQNKCFHGFHRNGAERNGGGNRENGDIHTLWSFCTDWQ